MRDEDADQLEAINPTDQDAKPGVSSAQAADSEPRAAAETPSTREQTAESQAATENEPEGKRHKGGFQRRIDELTRALREAKRDLDAEREHARRIAERAVRPAAHADESEPKREKFDDYDAYVDARARWVAEQTYKEQASASEARTREARRMEAALEAESAWNHRVEEARERHDDFDDYVDVVGTQINPDIAGAIKASDIGPDLVVYLGENPKELHRISALSGHKAAIAIGRLEAALAAKKPKPSSAPEPINPVSTKTAPKTNELRDDVPIDEWMKRRREQVRAG